MDGVREDRLVGLHRGGATLGRYQKFFGIGCTRSVVAAQAKLASTKTIGDMFVQYFFNLAEPGISADRVLNGPTNDVWIDPWVDVPPQSRGVDYHVERQGPLDRGAMERRHAPA